MKHGADDTKHMDKVYELTGGNIHEINWHTIVNI